MGFTLIDLGVLIVYLVAVLFIGLYFSKKDMDGKEFFKGDGTIPWWVASVSIFATLLSPISFLSLVGNSYSGTWSLWFAQLGVLIAIPLTIKFFLPVFSKLKIDTAYHYLEIRYKSKGLRVIGAIIFIIYQIGRMSIIMYLPSMVLSRLSNINVNIFIILMGAIAIVYSYAGGIKSVLWTDFIQGVVLILGVIGTLIFILFKLNDGFGDIVNALFNEQKFLSSNDVLFDPNLLKTSIFMLVVGGGLNTFSSYISSQDVVQRFTTTTDIKKLNKMTYANGILSIGVATLFYLIGTALFVFYRQNPNFLVDVAQDQIYASFIAYQLPVGITGLLLAAIYAASQSTLSTGLNSVATSWTLDIQNYITKGLSFKAQTKIAQSVSLLVGVVSVIVAMILATSEINSAYEWFNGFVGAVLGVLAGIFVLGVICKNATKISAYLGFITATIIVLSLKYMNLNIEVSIWAYSLITIVVTVGVGFVVSLFNRKNN